MTVLAVDGHVYSTEVLNESIAHPRNDKISIIVRNFDSVETRKVQYAGGIRYPRLEPIPGSDDYLSEILAAKLQRALKIQRADRQAGRNSARRAAASQRT